MFSLLINCILLKVDVFLTQSEHLKRGLDLLRGFWKSLPHTILEDHGLVVVGDTLVHHWAVAVTLHVSLEALMRTAPAHFADLRCGQGPVGIAVEIPF